MKREGGVGSPGMPSKPEPWPSGAKVCPPIFRDGAATGESLT